MLVRSRVNDRGRDARQAQYVSLRHVNRDMKEDLDEYYGRTGEGKKRRSVPGLCGPLWFPRDKVQRVGHPLLPDSEHWVWNRALGGIGPGLGRD